MSTDTTGVDLVAAVCPTCGRMLPRPIDVDSDGTVTGPCGHRVRVEEVVAR